ncbi:DUF3606 domain-containing protein [Mesorhizobium sp. B4-1-3]|uniref:DUF3606 domain-containing protein n=1 Tax=Mesorhizobium sp. B4-1-3 TaxID=2589889 RepID=UPI00112E39D9|nr:DUF3606 domain-containing protein [Mesorhizobium sp. B4-1-3]TPI09260.1 DUF3606 domain-containing protein [Mesorhizobium sp. B4-1-3]
MARRDAATAKQSRRPRSRPLKGEETEVKHIVETQNLSPAQARELVRRYGNDWRKIEEAAKTYKSDD